MKQYIKNKIEKELKEFEDYYSAMNDDWEQLSDYENLYKIRIPLKVLALFVRECVGGKKYDIPILREIKDNNFDIFYSIKTDRMEEIMFSLNNFIKVIKKIIKDL